MFNNVKVVIRHSILTSISDNHFKISNESILGGYHNMQMIEMT